jgi:Phosphatase
MTRRPKSRLPPKLADPARERAERDERDERAGVTREPKGAALRDRLKREHVSGRSIRFGRDEVVGVMRRLVNGAPAARLGLPPFEDLELAHVEAAVAATYGWTGDGPRARIAPNRTIDGFTAACERILEVARGGGSLAFATARPASLHALHRALATAATAAGGTVLTADESGHIGPQGLRIWWIDRVAVLTDRASLLGDDSVEAAEEFLFTLPRPDLVVADRTFAGAAAGAGFEVVTFADLDAVALAVAAWQGRALRIVPLDERRPPSAYAPLLERIDQIARASAAEATPVAYRPRDENRDIGSDSVADPQPRVGS